MKLHRADGLIVTGDQTGIAPSAEDLESVREASDLPLLVGSGTNLDTLKVIGHLADGFIVGSAFKEGGRWEGPVEESRSRALVDAVHALK